MTTKEKSLIELRALLAKIEAHQQIIAKLLVHDNPNLVLLGQNQKLVVDECHALLTSMIITERRDYNNKEASVFESN